MNGIGRPTGRIDEHQVDVAAPPVGLEGQIGLTTVHIDFVEDIVALLDDAVAVLVEDDPKIALGVLRRIQHKG